MTSKPTIKGVYRIKNFVKDGPCYMQANTDSSSNPYVEMKVLDTFNPKQKVHIKFNSTSSNVLCSWRTY